MSSRPERIISIVAGPTASGKSAYALELGTKKGGCVINADAMQLYKELPILTAQPSYEEQSQSPHRLYGVLDASERINAARWCILAKKEIERCFKEGLHPILTGGTGFYLKALTEGLSPIPDTSDEMRRNSLARARETGSEKFHLEVSQFDPELAKRVNPNDTQRLAHGWAVFHETGKALSEWQKLPKMPPPANWKFEVVLILPEREMLYERIKRRFDLMLENNVMDEVSDLSKRIDKNEVESDANIIIAHGFRALRDYLQGKKTLEEARETGITDTRHYAKRQYTWFRHQIKEDAYNIQSVRIQSP
ncbi:MAG: tRNA (adenosine(37)-N6)-dimethylallyltransferase MiaA [Alphaproteobacteria bacterium]|nr:tRNA (adenosine(37)-N6)-dimethylallyltransferase MiaA [Alphaproteobacteria bacterium]